MLHVSIFMKTVAQIIATEEMIPVYIVMKRLLLVWEDILKLRYVLYYNVAHFIACTVLP